MSTSVSSANSILNLIYLATAWADLAQNDGSGPATDLDIALHVGAPATSAQTSNEATYTLYARVAVLRDGTGWTTASGGSLANFAQIAFPESGGGTNIITHVSVGNNDIIIHFGALAASRTITSGIQPQFAANALVSTMT